MTAGFSGVDICEFQVENDTVEIVLETRRWLYISRALTSKGPARPFRRSGHGAKAYRRHLGSDVDIIINYRVCLGNSVLRTRRVPDLPMI